MGMDCARWGTGHDSNYSGGTHSLYAFRITTFSPDGCGRFFLDDGRLVLLEKPYVAVVGAVRAGRVYAAGEGHESITPLRGSHDAVRP